MHTYVHTINITKINVHVYVYIRIYRKISMHACVCVSAREKQDNKHERVNKRPCSYSITNVADEQDNHDHDMQTPSR